MKKSLIIFDLDGTLVDSRPQILSAVEEARQELGYVQANSNYLVEKIGLPASELFLDLPLSESEIEEAVSRFRYHLRNYQLSPDYLFPKTFEVLKLLKERGYRLSVGTNKPSDLAINALEQTQILNFFDFVAGGESQPAKPDPSILKNCLDKMETSSLYAVMIGDRTEDMLAATAANMDGFALLQGVHNGLELESAGAKIVFPNMSELHEKLNGGWNFEDL